MEEYANNSHTSESTGPRASFLYTSVGGASSVDNNHHNHHHQLPINTTFHLLQSGGGGSDRVVTHPDEIKTESNNTAQFHPQIFQYPLMKGNLHHQALQHHHHHLLSQLHHQHQGWSQDSNEVEAIKAKIMAHPQYSNLLEAYMDCQKVGAPAEVVERLAAARQDFEARQRSSVSSRETCKDSELDQFMEAYYDMLVKYREELTRPMQEAMDFMRRIEAQLNMLCNGPIRIFTDDKCEDAGSLEEEQENSGGESEVPEIDPRAEDRELKNHLLKKYSGYLSSLKQELSKKKKKGKLPKEARQKLLNWWELHYKWPYPSESEKVALAESTGLDQKQINNWFINQRKRHWKPSEDMQFMVMDGLHPQNASLYMDGHYMTAAAAAADVQYRFAP